VQRLGDARLDLRVGQQGDQGDLGRVEAQEAALDGGAGPGVGEPTGQRPLFLVWLPRRVARHLELAARGPAGAEALGLVVVGGGPVPPQPVLDLVGLRDDDLSPESSRLGPGDGSDQDEGHDSAGDEERDRQDAQPHGTVRGDDPGEGERGHLSQHPDTPRRGLREKCIRNEFRFLVSAETPAAPGPDASGPPLPSHREARAPPTFLNIVGWRWACIARREEIGLARSGHAR
jgi:hypothetical protein